MAFVTETFQLTHLQLRIFKSIERLTRYDDADFVKSIFLKVIIFTTYLNDYSW